MKKRTFLSVCAAAFAVSFSGVALADGKVFRVGATPGPHAEIVRAAAKVAEKDGLNVQVVEFSNYVLPNQALADGELELNSFQHLPYLETQIQKQGLKLVAVAQSVAFPMGIYSEKLKDLKELPAKARVGIPNDPSNGARALLLLQSAGIIKLKSDFGVIGGVEDIIENPLNINFVAVDAAMLPRMLDEANVVAIPTNYAIDAGLSPVRDAIVIEAVDSPYTGIIAVRVEDKDSPDVAKFIKAYRSDEVKVFIEETFKGSVLPTW